MIGLKDVTQKFTGATRAKLDIQLDPGALSFADTVAPNNVEYFLDYYSVDGWFVRAWQVEDYPTQLATFTFRDMLFGSRFDIAWSLHWEQRDVDDTRKELKKQIGPRVARTAKDLQDEKLPDAANLVDAQDLMARQADLEISHEPWANVTLIVRVRARSLRGLNEQSAAFEKVMRRRSMRMRRCFGRQPAAHRTVTPLAFNEVGAYRSMPVSVLSFLRPLSVVTRADEKGWYFGDHVGYDRPIILDPLQFQNTTWIVSGLMGTGKSCWAKGVGEQAYLDNFEVNFVDRKGEYIALTEYYGGQVVDLRENTALTINLMDIDPDSPGLSDSFEDMLSVLEKGLQEPLNDKERGHLNESYMLFMDEHGVSFDRRESLIRVPTFEEFYQHFRHDEELNRVAAACGELFRGEYRSVFAGRTNIDLTHSLRCFVVPGDRDRKMLRMLGHLVRKYISSRAVRSAKPGITICDESWLDMSQVEDAKAMESAATRFRKESHVLVLITPTVSQICEHQAGRNVLKTACVHVLFKQTQGSLASYVREGVVVTDKLADHLWKCTEGQGVLLFERAGEPRTTVLPFASTLPEGRGALYGGSTTAKRDGAELPVRFRPQAEPAAEATAQPVPASAVNNAGASRHPMLDRPAASVETGDLTRPARAAGAAAVMSYPDKFPPTVVEAVADIAGAGFGGSVLSAHSPRADKPRPRSNVAAWAADFSD